MAEYEPFKEAGIRALAVLSENGEAAMPDLPTAREQEVDAIHGLMQFWWAPKGTPPDRVAYLEKLLRQVMETSTVKARLAQLHVEPGFHVGDDLQAVIKERIRDLEGLQLEKPAALPPVHWLVLGFVGLYSVSGFGGRSSSRYD